ncbi:hypothetical protein S7W_08413 [Mycobacteroides abscessus M94]|nr:hypothetical protein S7W_08413 [Mycobacteroides abscessus M94]
MDIGIALPFMCRDYTRESTITWARLADEGPFSTISSGERISYHNQDMWVTLAAAAAVTERVRILANVSVLPAHPVPLVAKQAATLDVLSEGRFILGVGVGGREHDYRCLDASFGRRHQRLDDQVAELRRLWRAVRGCRPRWARAGTGRRPARRRRGDRAEVPGPRGTVGRRHHRIQCLRRTRRAHLLRRFRTRRMASRGPRGTAGAVQRLLLHAGHPRRRVRTQAVHQRVPRDFRDADRRKRSEDADQLRCRRAEPDARRRRGGRAG